MSEIEIRQAYDTFDSKTLDELLVFYTTKLENIKKARLDYLYSTLIDKKQAETPVDEKQRDNRTVGLAYFTKYSLPMEYSFALADVPLTRGAFCYNNLYFIRENWAYSIVSATELTLGTNPYKDGAAAISECLGVRKLLHLLKFVSQITHFLFKFDTYLTVRPSDVDAVLDVFDFTTLDKSLFICRFINYNKCFSSLINTLQPCGNRALPTCILASLTNKPSANFVRVVESVCSEIQYVLQKRIVKATQICDEYYTKDFALTLPEKIKDKNIKILLITTRASTAVQYFTRDTAEGFRAIGCKVLTLIEKENDSNGIRADNCICTIAEFKPDVIFQIDYFRYSNPMVPKNVPFITWIQDMLGPTVTGEHLSKLNNNDIIIDMCLPIRLEEFGYKDISFFPVHLNSTIYDISPDNVIYTCDIAIVNHFSLPQLGVKVNNEDMTESIVTLLSPIFKQDIHQLVTVPEWIKALSPLLPILDFSDPNHRLLIEDIRINIGNSLCRGTFTEWIVEWLADLNYTFHLWGNDWDKISKFQPYAKGAALNGKILAQIYNSAKINIYVHPCVTVHPRVFDSIASGGFMLIKKISGGRDLAPIDTLLSEGEGYIFFDNRADFEKKVKYYLSHDKERIEIIKRGQKAVFEKCTVAVGAQKILDILSKRFAT